MFNKFNASKNEFYFILFFLKNNFFSNTFFSVKNKNLSNFFNLSNFYKYFFHTSFWIKVRVSYYVNNWIYTTNHKRIAVNYFWFVILSGIVGMVLATLMRLEFAYPGVGVFAGDSLQYLSTTTAHGVIMVFFMIIPLLLGAFANFLIPTQLGVHDVAFPRLNSAAFWFLPGGLLMLCQLVCTDRRYQRMNCFNIREIESILKRKFFTDLINTHDHKTLLDKTAMGLRFKTNGINSIHSNIFNFYNYGIEFSPKIRTFNETYNLNFNSYTTPFLNSFFSNLINFFNLNNFLPINVLNNFYLNNFTFLSFLNFNINFKYFFLNFFNLISSSALIAARYLEIAYDNLLHITTISLNIYPALVQGSNNLKSIWDAIFLVLFHPVIIDRPLTKLFWITYDYLTSFIYNSFFFYNFFNFNFSLFNLNNFNLNNNLIDFFFYNFFSELLSLLNFNTFYELNFSFFYNFIFSLYNQFVNIFSNKFYSPLFKIETTLKNNISSETFFSNSNNPYSSVSYEQKNSFSSFRNNSLDYNSYFIYIYTFYHFFVSIPFFVFNTLINSLNVNSLLTFFSNFYNYSFSYYFPSLFSDNIIFLFYQKLNYNFLNSDFSIYNSPFLNFSSILFSFYNLIFINFNFLNLITNVTLIFNSFVIYVSNNIFNFPLTLVTILFSNKTNNFFSSFYFFELFDNKTQTNYSNNFNISYSSNFFSNTDATFNTKYLNEENHNNSRYLKFYNPVFKYDYKSGDYFPKLYKQVYSYLFTSLNDVTNSVRTAPWFISENYAESFKENFFDFYKNITKTSNTSFGVIHQWSSSRFNNTDGFYNFFFVLSNDFNYTNKKWISLGSLNQKFYRMFNTSSMQQRIYSNWRQLKFTREAWRCKLLAARHQKTLFRRYFHEDGVFWSIERNAKDVLPGWAMITPFSARTRFTAVGKTDIGLMGVFLVINSSIISAANFLVTYRYLSTLNNRKTRDARVFFTESIIVANWMMIFANPMLAIAIIMLLSDRHWQTSFFDYSGGGDTVLFQHMFWFFGHPEVYIVIIPTFGFVNSILSYYLRKRVSARASLMYSMYTIAFLGFFVWGHHMYMVGLSHTTRMLFSTLTVMISVPAATKIMHWCVTTVNSSISMELPLLFVYTFIFLFVSGGISGMAVAHTGMDVLFHDTFYVIGHFHVMFAGGAMFASFGAFYFYFPAIFGVKFSRVYAYLHYSYYLIGQLMTVIPMFWLGYAGMPRRVLDYPASMGGWHSVISSGHMLSVAGLMAFFIAIFDSIRQGRAVTRNSFGIGRYNTRLNFYLYEISRTNQIHQKSLALFKQIKPSSIKLNNHIYYNFEPFETTLITYTFAKK